MFHHMHGLAGQPTDRNQRLLQSQRPQLHDGSWSSNPTTPDDGHSNHPQTGKRHGHPQPARQSLMLVNNQKSGHLGPGCHKHCTHKRPVSLHKPTKPAFRNNHTQFWVGEKLGNHLVRMPQTHGPEASCLDTTRQDDRNREPATPTSDVYLRPMSQSKKQYIILRRSHGQVTNVSGQDPHITTEYYADSRHRTPRPGFVSA